MIAVERNAGHPWSGAAGWDIMTIVVPSPERAAELVSAGERKHWRLWIQSAAGIVMYKPSGAVCAWDDSPQWMGCNRDAARALAVGDEVFTRFSGRVTQHTITHRQPDFELGKAPPSQPRKVQVSYTGVLVKVRPDVPGSGGGWMDPAWFKPIVTTAD